MNLNEHPVILLQTELLGLPITALTLVLYKLYIVTANRNEQILYFSFAHWYVICINVIHTHDSTHKKW